jgi:hypothetical protein
MNQSAVAGITPAPFAKAPACAGKKGSAYLSIDGTSSAVGP